MFGTGTAALNFNAFSPKGRPWVSGWPLHDQSRGHMPPFAGQNVVGSAGGLGVHAFGADALSEVVHLGGCSDLH